MEIQVTVYRPHEISTIRTRNTLNGEPTWNNKQTNKQPPTDSLSFTFVNGHYCTDIEKYMPVSLPKS